MPRAADAVGCNHPPGSIPDPPQLAEHAGTDSPGDPRSRFKVAVALSMRGSSRFSAVQHCEDTPAEVLAPVPGVPRRTGCEFSAHFISQVVMSIGIEPPADGDSRPCCGTDPAVTIGQHHLDHIAAEQAE